MARMNGAVVAVLATLLVVAAAAEAAHFPGFSLCKLSKPDLDECKPYCATGSAMDGKPVSDKCCAALHHADLQCLCDYKNNNPGVLKAMNIDGKRAMGLPGRCGIYDVPAACSTP